MMLEDFDLQVGGAEKGKGSPKSVKFVFWGKWMAVHNFIVLHPAGTD